jgi:hypothetical protein
MPIDTLLVVLYRMGSHGSLLKLSVNEVAVAQAARAL